MRLVSIGIFTSYISNMPDTECIQIFATLSSCTIAVLSMASKAVHSYWERNMRIPSFHSELQRSNPVIDETQRALRLMQSTMLADTHETDKLYKSVLTMIAQSVSKTWSDLLNEKTRISDDMCMANLSYNMETARISICELDQSNNEFCAWVRVVITDCTEAFQRCMIITRKSYKQKIKTRVDACAVCLSSKVRVYIRYLHMQSTHVMHQSQIKQIVVHICTVLEKLGIQKTSWEVLNFPLVQSDASEYIKSCVITAVQNGSVVSCGNDDQHITAIPSDYQCLVVHSTPIIGKVFSDICTSADVPSMFIMVCRHTNLIKSFFVSSQSRLLTDMAVITEGMYIKDLIHIGTSTSVLRHSLTPVKCITYAITTNELLISVEESLIAII